MTGVESWWPRTYDPAEHLARMLQTVDWPGLRAGGPLHPELANRLQTSALWIVEGRTDNPLVYGVGDDIEGVALIDVSRSVLAWLQVPNDPALIAAVLLASRSCFRFAELMDDDDY